MKASDLFVRCLEEEGITHIFGVPGEENADLMMSLEGSNIRFVLCRHEQGAAFMAGVYGRLTGNPAACLGTLGPGAANLITGVADGNMDRAPMLVITGQGSTERLHKESHQIMDVVSMFQPVTKWAYSLRTARSIPEVIRKAVRTARSEKPGAVLIELSEDLAKHDTEAKPMEPRRFRRPGIDDKIADRAFERILAARAPVIIAGNGAIRKRASKQLRRFCEMTGIGVMSTMMGKGAVDVDAPYSLFTVGLGQRDIVVDAIDASDLVICLGYDMVEYPPRHFNPRRDKEILHIDFMPAEVDANYHPTVELVGDVAHSLWALNTRWEKLVEEGKAPRFDLGVQASVRERMQAEMEMHKDDDTEGSIRPQKVLWDVRQALGPDDVVLSGVGAHKMWIARHYHCNQPNTCIIPNGFCSMGLPLPGAVAAALARPEAKILGICGDGDFMMNVQEMETARRLNANITVMVWEDGGYGLISWKQENEFKRHTDLSFGNPDWLDLARAFGWHGQTIANARELRPALDAALAHEGPSLIALPIDYRENPKLSERLGRIEVRA